MTRKVAQFKASGEILRHLLGLPDGTLIYAITQRVEFPDEFTFYVEHADLPELLEGARPIDCDPIFENLDGERKPHLIDWNLQTGRSPHAQ